MRALARCLLLGLAALAACTPLPPVDGTIAEGLHAADTPKRLALLRREGERVTGVPFSTGNRASLLRDGEGALPAITAAIDGATSTIDLETYVFDERDGLGIAERLITRRAAGVEVNLIYDAWGSLATPKATIERLRAAGVQVLEFNPLSPTSVIGDRGDHRDHRKLLVVDGRLAITGGINISGVYLRDKSAPNEGDPNPDRDYWRDTDIRVEGPAVADFERSFRDSWTRLKGPELAARPVPEAASRGDLQMQVITNTPEHEDHDIYSSLLLAITLAQHSVHLTTGFFVPTRDLRDALRAAARRGVEVRVLVPRNSTSPAAVEAGRAYYEDLLEDGVHLHEYPADRVLHAKTAVIDGEWSMVGSSNLDRRSVVLNDELSTVILGASFGSRLDAMFAKDLSVSAEIDPATWSRRPLSEKFREWRARLFEYFL